MSLYSPTDSEQSVLDTFAWLEPWGISYLDWQHGPHSPRAKSPVIWLFPSESLSEKRQHVGRFRARIDANSIPREVCILMATSACITLKLFVSPLKHIGLSSRILFHIFLSSRVIRVLRWQSCTIVAYILWKLPRNFRELEIMNRFQGRYTSRLSGR